MKIFAKVVTIVLAVSIIAGCATSERLVYVEPECVLPPMPAPPEVTALELDPLTDEVYWRVLRREREITDALLEHRAMLRELCGG